LSQKHRLPYDILYTSPVEHTRFVERGIWCDQPVVASATNPTLFTFNYLDIDSLYFTSSGGQPAFFNSGGGEWFAMDNFTFEFVPEPSTFLLAALGGVSLVAFFKRKRA
jgi:hypothetical protein